MTIYSLDGVTPELPPENEYWIAPNAVIVGKVKLALSPRSISWDSNCPMRTLLDIAARPPPRFTS